jgi:hypothetical protein
MNSVSFRPLTLVLCVGLIIVLSITACATFRKPGEPAPTRPPTLTPSPTVTLSPEPSLTSTPTLTFTPQAASSTEQ